ncbi:MAG: arsenate reductase ArsC [Proteobacteria bacterium]|nr:arsenate reductase ArsC [Pseudomonadota bacterium]
MADKTYNVLFICTGNSARSILAEGLMNALGKGRFRAYSAGSHPNGKVNPFALETLESFRIPTDGYRSKNWDEFAKPDAPRMDFVLTVCDKAACEVCPVWPGQPMTAHWGVADPAAFEGPDDAKRQQFRDAAITLKRRIELMLALPLDRLDTMAIHREVKDIGTK